MMMDANNHSFKFFLYTHEAWDAIYSACESAKSTILLEQFILVDDESGRPLINILKKKASEGVRIKLLIDAVGSSELFQSSLESELNAVGIQTIFFNAILPLSVRYHTSIFFRDHRKVIVIDSEKAFTGGVGFQAYMRNWRDTCVMVSGPVVEEMKDSFDIMWHRSQKIKHKRVIRKIVDGNHPFAFLENAPFPGERHMYYELVNRINSAKREIKLVTPYFSPDKPLKKAIRRAASRGVDTTLLIPKFSSQKLVDLAGRSHFTKLLIKNAKIFLSPEPLNHSKVATIDGEWSMIGSLNLDYISLRYNFEACLVSTDKMFASELNKHFEQDCRISEQVKLEDWVKRSKWQKFLERLIRPIRFLL